MCIAAPAQVVEINREDNLLIADFGGKTACKNRFIAGC